MPAYTYAEIENRSAKAYARKIGYSSLNKKTRGECDTVHAVTLQALYKHGKDSNPQKLKAVVNNAVRREMARQYKRKYGSFFGSIWASFLPLIIEFVEKMFPMVLAAILEWLNSLADDEQPVALKSMVSPAKSVFLMDDDDE